MWQMIPRLLHVQLSGLSVLDFLWALQSIRYISDFCLPALTGERNNNVTL